MGSHTQLWSDPNDPKRPKRRKPKTHTPDWYRWLAQLDLRYYTQEDLDSVLRMEREEERKPCLKRG